MLSWIVSPRTVKCNPLVLITHTNEWLFLFACLFVCLPEKYDFKDQIITAESRQAQEVQQIQVRTDTF